MYTIMFRVLRKNEFDTIITCHVILTLLINCVAGTVDHHDGICVYVCINVVAALLLLFSKRRHDLELPNIVCIWVEVEIKNKMQLIGTFFRPPKSTNAMLTSTEDSIGLALETIISNILMTVDFNFDILKDSSIGKVKDLCQQLNFDQIINGPAHFFTENSSSLIGLILTSNRNSILISSVLQQNIRYQWH